MYEIVVLSGKGGTGKTSITAALSVLAGAKAVIADCDVDAANMHLLMKPDFAEASEFFSGEIAEINQDLCSQCGRCAEVCKFNAIPYLVGHFEIQPLDCEGCDYCRKVCPENAITLKPRKSGMLYKSTTRLGTKMVHAKMDIGADNSGKLVAQVKQEAKAIGKLLQKEFMIVDGSPGTGCPVVSALAGAHFVLLVTEPTMSGLHDLKRVYQIIKKMRLKTGCVINKADINKEKTNEIKEFLDLENISHLADIDYDKQFTQAMLNGKTIVETDSVTNEKLKNVWRSIQAIYQSSKPMNEKNNALNPH